MMKFFHAAHDKSLATSIAVSTLFGCAAGAVGTLLVVAFVAPTLVPEYAIAEPRPIGTTEQGVSAAGVESSLRALAYLAPARATAAAAQSGYAPEEAFGMGVALTSDGWIVTHDAAIVAKGKRDMAVIVDGIARPVTRTVRDPYTGAVFAKTDASDLAVVPFGDANDLAPGDIVFVLDPAEGLTQMTVASFDVRPTGALDAAVRSSDTIQRVLRLTGATPFPGAMVLDRRGQMVAMVASQDALGTVAVPMKDVSAAIGGILRGGVAERPTLGLSYVDLARVASSSGAPKRGAHVMSLVPGGAAAAAGLRAGDVILSVNDEPVSSKKGLSEIVVEYAIGDKLTLAVQRGTAAELRVIAVLGTSPAVR